MWHEGYVLHTHVLEFYHSWQCSEYVMDKESILNVFYANQMLCLALQWVPEITHHCPKTPFLLVGTMIDLRDDAATIEKLSKVKQRPISREAAEKLAHELRAVKYVECSALTQKGLKDVFEEAVLAVIKQSEHTKKGGWLHMPKVSLPNLFKGELLCHTL